MTNQRLKFMKNEVIEDVTAVVWSPIWSSTIFFALLVVLLVVRPQGLLGRLEGRKQ